MVACPDIRDSPRRISYLPWLKRDERLRPRLEVPVVLLNAADRLISAARNYVGRGELWLP
jgi:hypothetical protein